MWSSGLASVSLLFHRVAVTGRRAWESHACPARLPSELPVVPAEPGAVWTGRTPWLQTAPGPESEVGMGTTKAFAAARVVSHVAGASPVCRPGWQAMGSDSFREAPFLLRKLAFAPRAFSWLGPPTSVPCALATPRDPFTGTPG